MSNSELNTLISKIDELKSIIISEKKISNNINDIINDFNNFKQIINSLEDQDISSISTINEKVILIKNNNTTLNQNYDKLISKPIALLEIIYNALKEGKDLTNDLESIKTAIDKIKKYEENNIKSLKSQNETILEELQNLNIEPTINNSNNNKLIETIENISNKLNDLKISISEIETNNTNIHNTIDDINTNSIIDVSDEENSFEDEDDFENDNVEDDLEVEDIEEISTKKEKPLNINIEYAKNEDEELDEE